MVDFISTDGNGSQGGGRKRRGVWKVRNRVSKEKQEFARQLRKNPTVEEAILWSRLKGRQVEGRTFGRQKIIFGWIVDFYCASDSLVVEVDGLSHVGKEGDDAERDQVMTAAGFRVLRFTNDDVKQNIDGVVESIRLALQGKPVANALVLERIPADYPKKNNLPAKRKRIPGTDNLVIFSNGEVWQWNREGQFKLETKTRDDGEETVVVKIDGFLEERTIKDLMDLTFRRTKESDADRVKVLRQDALAHQVAGDFLLANYKSGPVSVRRMKRVANRLKHTAEKLSEQADYFSPAYTRITRNTKESL